MDIPIRRHINNAYEAARQLEHETERQKNRNLHRAMRSIRMAKAYISNHCNPIEAARLLQIAINSLDTELKERGME